MSVSQACPAANTATLAPAFLSLGRLGAIATTGVSVAHAGTAMLGSQSASARRQDFQPVRHRKALASVTDMLSRAARPGHPPQAAIYPVTMDAHASIACHQALAYRLRIFEFTPNRQDLSSAESHAQT